MKFKNGFVLPLFLLAANSYADLPLSLEGIAPKQNRLKIGASLTYYNSSSDIHSQGASTYLLTPQNTTIEIPGRLRSGHENSDVLYTHLNLQYGLTANTEIYTGVGALWRQNRYSDENGHSSRNHHELSDVILGVNQIVLSDGANPMLTATLETSVLEKIRGKNVHARSWFAGITAYKAIDPVVFSLTTGYRFNFNNSTERRPGNYWLIRPGVSFAANDHTTFNARLQWTGRQGDRIRGKKTNAFESSTHATLGVGYAFSNQTSLSADVQWNLSGDSGANATLALQHRF